MSNDTEVMTAPTARDPDRSDQAGAGTLWLYTLTTLLSAVLLFSIQPMFAKMVLPVLGGSPSVWAVALAFFQGALLAGYLYAHGLMRFLTPKQTGFVHLLFCMIALVALPIALPEGWREPPPGDAYLWQFGLFAIAIGLPFMAVAANAPLLQAWFARTGHAQSADPYFLYAASNLGSFFALLGYPLLLEPVFGATKLSAFWAIGYIGLMTAIALCFAVIWRRQETQKATPLEAAQSEGGPADYVLTWKDRVTWVGLALVPAALLTAFTTYVATDVASAPLIWVIPLALYLLTFVIVFRDSTPASQADDKSVDIIAWLHVISVFLVFLQLSQVWRGGWFLTTSLGFSAFVSGTLIAHRTLYQNRPNAKSLTEFYLWMSFGGVLGGLFAALLAPKLFSEVYEYPLLLALTLACRPGVVSALRSGDFDVKSGTVKIVAGIAAVFGFAWLCAQLDWTFDRWGSAMILIIALAIPLFYYWRRPVHQLAVALMMVAVLVFLPTAVHVGNAERSYFGVYRISKSDDGQFTVLQHGSTLHGAQRRQDADGNAVHDLEPATYYYRGGPIHYAVASVQHRLGQDGKGHFGVVGLGAGAMACHAKPGETWKFYEIDPVVVDIARSENFSFMKECQPDAEVVVGDARLTLEKEPDGAFDLLVIDAFSSDAVPVHLLTQEALELYVSKLKPEGVGVLHISNRYLDLEGVVHATLQNIDGVKAFILEKSQDERDYEKTSSQIAVFSKDMRVAHGFMRYRGARTPRYADLKPWTDDASDILAPFLSNLKKLSKRKR